jgi:carboxypeptidase Taq
MMEDKLNQLKARLARVADLTSAAGLLQWDQQTKMPPGGSGARGDQLGTLEGLAHEMFVDEEVGALVEDLQPYAESLPFESDDASIIRVAWREYQKSVRMSKDLVERMAQVRTAATEAWHDAKVNSDFSRFEGPLNQMLEVLHAYAAALGSKSGNPYDALLDFYEPGLTYEYTYRVFSGLKQPLVDLIAQIAASPNQVDAGVIQREYPAEQQLAFGEVIAAGVGYDFERGRMDLTAHPFASGGFGDARITTKVDEHWLPTCLMSVLHEAGHAIHFQNFSLSLYRTTPSINISGAICESQSRFWENHLGRSRAFWVNWYPHLQAAFPQLADTALDSFYQAINRSQPSLIRIEADEVTYGLHVMLRAELENDLINGRVRVADLPKEWNARMEAYLGVVPPDDAQGVLQDVHWSWGLFGYFPTYLLGSMLAAQTWEVIRREHPRIQDDIAAGDISKAAAWQRENIQQHGGKFTFTEITERATGQALSWEPYMNYLRAKYGEIYGLA